jgi:hypothetical protein
MTEPMEANELHLLFGTRTHSRGLTVLPASPPANKVTGSRVGGRPPASVVDLAPTCPRCGGGLEYVMTLACQAFSAAESEGDAVSLLCCRDMACRMGSASINDPPSIVALCHKNGPRSSAPTALDSPFEERELGWGVPEQEPRDQHGDSTAEDSKIGGLPSFFQSRGWDDDEKANAMGLGLLLQWSESIFPREGMVRGAYPFMFGTVYVYCKFDANRAALADGTIKAFWLWS